MSNRKEEVAPKVKAPSSSNVPSSSSAAAGSATVASKASGGGCGGTNCSNVVGGPRSQSTLKREQREQQATQAATSSAATVLGGDRDPLAVPPGLGSMTRRRESAGTKDLGVVGEPVRKDAISPSGGGSSSAGGAVAAGVSGAKRRGTESREQTNTAFGRTPRGPQSDLTAAVSAQQANVSQQRGSSQQRRPVGSVPGASGGAIIPIASGHDRAATGDVNSATGLSASVPVSAAAAAVSAATDVYEAPSGETTADSCSFDEEVELLRCEAELVEAAADIGTTSADDDLLMTDQELDDEEDGLAALPLPCGRAPRTLWQRPSAASVVIEEDDEDISSGMDDLQSGLEVDSFEMRSRLWAQSLLRLKRSIDEIYSLCEFESDEGLCDQVKAILDTASGDFNALIGQFDTQQEYTLLAGEYPFKSGVAWTTRTPRASRSSGNSALELLEKAQLGSPAQNSPVSATGSRQSGTSRSISSSTKFVGHLNRRSRSLDPKSRTAWIDEDAAVELGGGSGDAVGGGIFKAQGSDQNRAEQLEIMVQSALHNINNRLGRQTARLSPEELLKRTEERQRRAQQLRASQDDQRLQHVRTLEGRIAAARERRQQKEEEMQRELLEKMTRARRQYQDQLRIICNRARNQNRKSAEVAFIRKAQADGTSTERELLKRKQENAQLARMLKREQMRKRLVENASRISQVSENRRRQVEMWQFKVQQGLEEKERLASQRRQEYIDSVRLKSQGQESRSEMVRGKRRELQEEDERSANEMLGLGRKHLGHKLTQLSCCDSLPDGVREEVAEQLTTSRVTSSASGAGRGRHSTTATRTRTKAVKGLPTASSSTSALDSGRPCTPPPASCYSVSPKGSPSLAEGTEVSDCAEVQQDDVVAGDAASPPETPIRTGEDLDVDAGISHGSPEQVSGCRRDEFSSAAGELHSGRVRAKARGSLSRSKASGDGRGGGRTTPGGNSAARTSSPATSGTVKGAIASSASVIPTSSSGVNSVPAAVVASTKGEDRNAGDSSASGGSDESDGELVDSELVSDAALPDFPIIGGGSDVPGSAAAPGGVTAGAGVGNAGQGGSINSRQKPPRKKQNRKASVITNSGELEAAAQRHFRGQLASASLSDEEALKIACEFEGNTAAAAANAAQRARISKLATDLGKVISPEDTSVNSINLDRADGLLADFNKVLSQSQREADFTLLLKLGCASKVVDICSIIKNSIVVPVAERSVQTAWKQIGSVMLNALKWLGLLSKQKIARVFLLMTNRIVPLADVAIACLDAHAAGATAGPGVPGRDSGLSSTDAHNNSILFLPQVLHVLSLHVKQTLPVTACDLQQKLISYLLVSGLPEKLRELFKRAEVQGMKIFTGASHVPLLLLRAMAFLGTLVSAYQLPALPVEVTSSATEIVTHREDTTSVAAGAAVLRTLRRTELFGIVSVLVSILLSEGRRLPQNGRLPQTVVSLSVQAVRILNHIARMDLATLQETLGVSRQQELYHLMVCLFDYCSSRLHGARTKEASEEKEESELLHETITLLGFYCLQCPDNQSIMCYGEGQMLLTKIASLPLHYFMDDRGRHVLFPTILATCFQSQQNLEVLRNEMNLSLLRNYLTVQQAQPQRDEAFASRFPAAHWAEALEFFTDE